MNLNSNTNATSNSRTNGRELITNPHTCVAPTLENPHGYPLFNIYLVSNYMNNQLTYYYTSGVIFATDQAQFQQFMKQYKISLDLLDWDGAFPDENDRSKKSSEDSDIPEN